MIDSGASCNFISKSVFATLGFSGMTNRKYSVRLANGKILKTCGQVKLNIRFGTYYYLDWFHVLECEVPSILGMTFLAKVRPQLDFVAKTISVKRRGQWFALPSVELVNGRVKVDSGNSFEGLEVEHSMDSGDQQLAGNHCDDNEEVTLKTRVRKCVSIKCAGCSKQLSSDDVDKKCKRCSNHSFGNLRNQFDDKSKRYVSSIETVPLSQFRRDFKRGRYLHCGMINVWNENEQVDLNFTHRSTLGGGDDADIEHGQLQGVAEQTMAELKQKYGAVFEEPKYPVDRSDCEHQFEHTIPLIDESLQPPRRKLYPLDNLELQELKKQIQLFLDTNRIEPANGAYGAPILFAKKKDGGLRMCIDYRMLNAQTQNDVFPLPRIDELLQRLDGACIFSKLDLRDGYHQVPMKFQDKVKTSFSCRYGTYQFTVMPFGLSNAPSSFQRIMNKVFFKLLDNGVLCYLDDLLIYSKDVDSHKRLLDEVFSLLHSNKLYIKESKCHLFLQKVNFLGHVVSKEGLALESGKVDVIEKWPVPTTVTHVQQFLGLCNYYRRFILRFSEIASPMSQLTRKGVKFDWQQQQQLSFDRLKQCLASAPVLKIFDPAVPTRVVSDASDFCVGAVLEQQVNDQWHPVEYFSKRLNKAQLNYSATDREFVAIQLALERWRQFLVGIHFELLTDHAALTYLQSSVTVSRRNARWLDFLSQFTFDIKHIRGKENIVADALSRVPGADVATLQLCNIQHTLGIWHQEEQPVTLGNIITIHENESFLQQLLIDKKQSQNSWFLGLAEQAKLGSKIYVYRNDILCKLVGDTFCPVIPDHESSTVHVILSDLHSSALGGHFGQRKLLLLAQKRFFWQKMAESCALFVKKCSVCQANKHSTQKPVGLLRPVENPGKPFDHVTMDFITSLPISNRGYDCIYTIVDRFSRYVKFIPCKTTMNAVECAQLFFEHWVCKFGMPVKIISDRDVKFQSKFWQELNSLLQCRVAMSTSYHPQTDGLSERYHRTLEQVLRCYCSTNQQQWCELLSQCEFAINSSFQESVGDCPFKILYGLQPSMPIDSTVKSIQVPAVTDFVAARDAVQTQVRQSLQSSQKRMAEQANRRRRDIQLAVGQHVWLSSRNLPLRAGSRKLAALWTGPFLVKEAISDVAFRLELPDHWNIHDVFHVSQMKAAVGKVYREEVIEVNGDVEFEVEAILDDRVLRGNRQFLVKWKGYDFYENTWEPEANLQNSQELLDQYLAGKLRSRKGGSVTVS